MMKIGFTGTREGMADEQREAVRKLLHELKPAEVHHGDCVGADEQFASLADFEIAVSEECIRRPVIAAHPSNINGMCAFSRAHLRHPRKPPLVRNRDIVDAVELLIAAPKDFKEVQFSGTWATIRYAKKVGKPIKIVHPDGLVVNY